MSKTAIQLRLWNHDCGHKYVIMVRTKAGLQMMCVHCGSDVEMKSTLVKAAQEAKARRLAHA